MFGSLVPRSFFAPSLPHRCAPPFLFNEFSLQRRHAFRAKKVRRSFVEFKHRRRCRLIHVDDLSKRCGPIYKLDGYSEKLVYLTFGYRVTLNAELKKKIETQRAKKASRLKVNLFLRPRNLEDEKSPFEVKRKIFCVPFVSALNQRLLETLTLDELEELNKYMPKIFETFEKLESRRNSDHYKKDQDSIPRSSPGIVSLKHHDLNDVLLQRVWEGLRDNKKLTRTALIEEQQ